MLNNSTHHNRRILVLFVYWDLNWLVSQCRVNLTTLPVPSSKERKTIIQWTTFLISIKSYCFCRANEALKTPLYVNAGESAGFALYFPLFCRIYEIKHYWNLCAYEWFKGFYDLKSKIDYEVLSNETNELSYRRLVTFEFGALNFYFGASLDVWTRRVWPIVLISKPFSRADDCRVRKLLTDSVRVRTDFRPPDISKGGLA